LCNYKAKKGTVFIWKEGQAKKPTIGQHVNFTQGNQQSADM